MAKKRAAKKESERKPVKKRTPKAAPPREKTEAELRAEGLYGKGLRAALAAQITGRKRKPPQIVKGGDTRPMVQRRYEAELASEANPTGKPILEKVKTSYSKWQLSVQANPARAKKPWKVKEDKASGKKGSTKASDKSKDGGITRGSSAKALVAAGKKAKKKAQGARIKSSKKAKRGKKAKRR